MVDVTLYFKIFGTTSVTSTRIIFQGSPSYRRRVHLCFTVKVNFDVNGLTFGLVARKKLRSDRGHGSARP